MDPRVWKETNPLYRGDEKLAVDTPDPASKTKIVAHVLYLGGKGRPTPYTSTTESQDVAEHFAGSSGRVWKAQVSLAKSNGAGHFSKKQLLENLKGGGKGKAKWKSAYEVAQAAVLVKLWSEHLFDWSAVSTTEVAAKVAATFDKA